MPSVADTRRLTRNRLVKASRIAAQVLADNPGDRPGACAALVSADEAAVLPYVLRAGYPAASTDTCLTVVALLQFAQNVLDMEGPA